MKKYILLSLISIVFGFNLKSFCMFYLDYRSVKDYVSCVGQTKSANACGYTFKFSKIEGLLYTTGNGGCFAVRNDEIFKQVFCQ